MTLDKKPWTLLLFLVVGWILFIVGNEQLLTYTRFNPASRMTQTQFQQEKTESLETRVWWTMQLGGLTLVVISLLEIALLGGKIHSVT